MLPEIDDLQALLRRMGALFKGSRDLVPTTRAWRQMRRKLEREFAKPEYPDGELLRVETLIFETDAFKNFNRVRKGTFMASPRGKAKRKAWDTKQHEKRKTKAGYKADKKAYDAARYKRRKNTGMGGGHND